MKVLPTQPCRQLRREHPSHRNAVELVGLPVREDYHWRASLKRDAPCVASGTWPRRPYGQPGQCCRPAKPGDQADGDAGRHSSQLPIERSGGFAAPAASQGGVAVPEGVDPADWEFMTPEESDPVPANLEQQKALALARGRRRRNEAGGVEPVGGHSAAPRSSSLRPGRSLSRCRRPSRRGSIRFSVRWTTPTTPARSRWTEPQRALQPCSALRRHYQPGPGSGQSHSRRVRRGAFQREALRRRRLDQGSPASRRGHPGCARAGRRPPKRAASRRLRGRRERRSRGGALAAAARYGKEGAEATSEPRRRCSSSRPLWRRLSSLAARSLRRSPLALAPVSQMKMVGADQTERQLLVRLPWVARRPGAVWCRQRCDGRGRQSHLRSDRLTEIRR